MAIYKIVDGRASVVSEEDAFLFPTPTKVVFDNPVTVVFFSDGSKQVVKIREEDEFNEELGLAMALARKALKGNGSQFVRLLTDATRRVSVEKRKKTRKNTTKE